MPTRVRDVCAQSLEFAIAERVLKPYHRSGRYLTPPRSRSLHAVDDEIKLIAHYGVCEGPLYADARAWKRAYELTSGFTKRESSRLDRRWWSLPRLFGPIERVNPADVLAQVKAALSRFGFQPLDLNEVTFTGVFTAADSCTVMDLPEPYGKWYQTQEGKPRWKQEVDLETDIRCEVFSEDLSRGAPGHFASFVTFELSSLAAPLLLGLEKELARLLHFDRLTADPDGASLKRTIVSALRQDLASR